MPELTTAQTKAAREFVYKRDYKDGEAYCWFCHRIPQKKSGEKERDASKYVNRLILAHLDGNRQNNPEGGENWRLLCDSCNQKMRKPQKPRNDFKSVAQKKMGFLLSRIQSREQRLSKSPQMVKSEAADSFFRQFITENITGGIEIHSEELLDGARNAFTEKHGKPVDQSTLEKVLRAVTSRMNGGYELDEETNMVRLRKNGTPETPKTGEK